MSEQENLQVVEHFWREFERRDFEAASAVLHSDYLGEWPQTGELVRGRSNFVAINQCYPEQWQVTIMRMVASGNQVTSEVKLTYQEEIVYAISFFELLDGKILKETDYWPEPYDPPAWRAQWVE